MKKGLIYKYSYFNAIAFTVVLVSMGILSFTMPFSKTSEVEKRDLTSMPVFSSDALFHGKYTDSLDLYYADHFPFRDDFVGFSFWLKERRGIRSKEIAFIANNNFAALEIPDSEKYIGGDTLNSNEGGEVGEIGNSEGLLIFNGMGIQVFGGNSKMAAAFAKVVNEYDSLLKEEINVFCLAIPTHGEFYLPESYKRHAISEGKNIADIYSNLRPTVIAVDVLTNMHKHQDEYIFFNSDHHWTGLGAYYAYEAFCDSAGLTAVPLDEMERKVIKNYTGSFYWQYRDSRLLEKKDSVVYHKPRISNKAVLYKGPGSASRYASTLYAEYAKGGAGYGVYVGGDHPMMKVETEVKNGKKIIAIKNSFGNAFVGYLISHYEEVYIIDYRYWEGNIFELIAKNNITDLVFLTPTFSANTSWHLMKMKNIIRKKNIGSKLPDQNGNSTTKDSLKTDSLLQKSMKDDSIKKSNE